MNIEYWTLANWLIKVALYLSIAFIVGGAFCYVLFGEYNDIKAKLLKYIRFGAGLGCISSVLGFFILIGSFANTGFLGMFDTNYIRILISTPMGDMQVIRIVSFTLILALMLIILCGKTNHVLQWHKVVLVLFSIPILYSFSQLGHVANLSFIPQMLLSTHVLVMSLWVGALYPLWCATYTITGLALKQRIHLFGRMASFIIALLVLCGVSIALLLFKDIDTLINTEYGYGFIFKMLLVLGIFVLAALNKWYLTPRLAQPKFAKKLAHAIVFEMFLALFILTTTAYITTVVGIE